MSCDIVYTIVSSDAPVGTFRLGTNVVEVITTDLSLIGQVYNAEIMG
jgi:hypothetical protein